MAMLIAFTPVVIILVLLVAWATGSLKESLMMVSLSILATAAIVFWFKYVEATFGG